MNTHGDPERTLIAVYHPDSTSVLIEVEETPLDVELKASAFDGASVVGGISTMLWAIAYLLPECSAKYHAFKAANTLAREARQIEDRMTAPPAERTDELPF